METRKIRITITTEDGELLDTATEEIDTQKSTISICSHEPSECPNSYNLVTELCVGIVTNSSRVQQLAEMISERTRTLARAGVSFSKADMDCGLLDKYTYSLSLHGGL